MKVREVMTTNVECINPDTSIQDAARIMQRLNIGSIPVCDNNGVVGIVTDRDIVIRNVSQGINPNNAQVSSIMSTNVQTVSPDADVSELSNLMSDQQVRRIPVVEQSSVVGIVSLGDIATNRRLDTEASEALSDISEPSKPKGKH